MTYVDLEPAARQMAGLVTVTPDNDLDDPTPCSAYSVGDLLDHVSGLTLAFTAAATKTGPSGGTPQPGDRSRLDKDWRTRIPRYLSSLSEAWRDPKARTGMTRAGGIEMPGEIAAIVVLEELVIHGWDLAQAIGQPYTCDDPAILETVAGFFGHFDDDARGDAYKLAVSTDDPASALDRIIALSGRDPAWRPPA